MSREYTYYSDSGHGWLKVPRSDIEMVNQAGKVSNYSYQHNEWVYLEEDCDMPMFTKALDNAEIVYEIHDTYTDGHSEIRDFESYRMRVIV